MKKLLTLILLLCAVVSLTAPVSAGDYFFYKDVRADDFTNALVDYCNGNTVYNMTEYEVNLSHHTFKTYDVVRTNKSLDFKFDCRDDYWVFVPPIPIPLPWYYRFSGVMHVVYPQDGLKKPYTLVITDDDRRFMAVGKNWRLEVEDRGDTRFQRWEPDDRTAIDGF